AFGICFQLPVVLTLLAKVGIVGSDQLKKGRKYAVVLTFLIAAFLTPPDLISQIGLAIPTILLYEFSILLVLIIEKNKETKDK
ncbi:MAG: twin-arginine translocase subunit TatC, partial [Alphaproteobacteria bacterium]|nr:twin-arginine translocase subunit TatC [Alphaproteobacteria bacterium]